MLGLSDSPGAGPTVRAGVISTSDHDSVEAYQPFFRTDAVTARNAGGILLDVDGRIVGIATHAPTGYRGDGGSLGFVVPSNTARWIMKNLLERGHVEHGFLGVTVQDLTGTLAAGLGLRSSTGVLVSEVATDAPGAKAGIERGDIIAAIDGRRVDSAAEFRVRIAAAKPNSTLGLDIVRPGIKRTVEATLGSAPTASAARTPPVEAPRNSAALGLSFAPLDRAGRKRWAVPDSVRAGVMIREVTPESASAVAGLRAGDVLLELNREPANDGAAVTRLLQRASGPAAVLAWRGGHTFFVGLGAKSS